MDKKDYYFKTFNAVRQPILIIDRDYTIVDANNAVCVLLNITYDKIMGQACFKLTHGFDKPCWQDEISCPARTAFNTQKQTRVIHKHSHADKKIFEEIVATPIFNDEGKINLVVEEFRDITELINLKEIREHFENEIKTLRGILPICASCKKIRDDKGYWQQVEIYVSKNSKAEFSHGYCPECLKKVKKEIRDSRNRKKK